MTETEAIRENYNLGVLAGEAREQQRIIKLLEETIVNSVKWQMTNRYWNDGKNEWNGGQESDNKYLQSMAGYLLAQILGEHELYKIANGKQND